MNNSQAYYEMWETQRTVSDMLALAQIKLLESIEKRPYHQEEIGARSNVENVPNGIKITVHETLPKLQVQKMFDRDLRAYQHVRDRWFNIIREALQGKEVECFDKYIIWIIHHYKYLCDPDNFSTKFIIDALKYLKVINQNENFNRLKLIVSGQVEKENPRTEIYVFHDTGQLDDPLKLGLNNRESCPEMEALTAKMAFK